MSQMDKPMIIPTYKQASARRVEGKHTSIDLFVTEYEPGVMNDCGGWRESLLAVWNESYEDGIKQGRMEEARDSLTKAERSARRALIFMKLAIVIGSLLYVVFALFLLVTLIAFAWSAILS